MSKLTDKEIARNMQFVDRAIAQPYLSGVRVSEETKADLRRVARGEMTTEDVIRKLKRRYQNDGVQG